MNKPSTNTTMETVKTKVVKTIKTDVFVIGAGITGMQAALDVADQGKQVVIVDRKPSLGGNMINLSKVFPTLDCASCITTPRMASVGRHPNIKAFTYSEVKNIEKMGSGYRITVSKKPRYVVEEDCIGCKRCEEACPIYVPDDFEHGLGAKKAISIPFTNAIPQYPVLEMENCIRCGACAKACPTNCINFLQEPELFEVEAQSIITATGFSLTPLDAKKQYGGAQYTNVLSPLMMERLLAPHGPYGKVLRPSDGKVPESIAYVQCAGSRDKSLGVPYCSRVCCMYAIKQAVLLSGSLPVADITIYYMDIRAFGKGYEQFYQNAKGMGIQFVKAKVAKISEDDDANLTLRIERQESQSQPEEVQHDLVVLSLGMVPTWKPEDMPFLPLQVSSHNFIDSPQPNRVPVQTNLEHVFAAGTAIGPKDIVDSIVEAGCAAMHASNVLVQNEKTH